MLFAAGLGSRLKPLTDTMPKALVPVAGFPLLQLVCRKLRLAGATEVVINVHHFGEQIIDYVAQTDLGLKVRISDEREMLLDTGGGLRRAVAYFDAEDTSPVLIHNVDILSSADLKAFHAFASGHDVALLVSERETSRYLLFDEQMRLVGWTNVKTGEVRSPYSGLDVKSCRRFAFSGIHCMTPKCFALLQEWPEKFPIMDFYLSLCDRLDIRGFHDATLSLMDVGKLDTLAAAEDFARKHDLLPNDMNLL